MDLLSLRSAGFWYLRTLSTSAIFFVAVTYVAPRPASPGTSFRLSVTRMNAVLFSFKLPRPSSAKHVLHEPSIHLLLLARQCPRNRLRP